MSVVVVALDRGRWPLQHGQHPLDLLGEHGWTGTPVGSGRAADGTIEVFYEVTALTHPSPPRLIASGGPGTRQLQRVASYAVVVDRGRVLMSQLSERVVGAAGRWTLPGGGVDPGETPLDAVVREVVEETGQHVVIDGLAQVQSSHWITPEPAGVLPGEDFHAVRLVHRARCPEATPARVMEVDGSTGASAWVPLHQVPGMHVTQMVRDAWHLVPGGGSHVL